MRLYVRLLLGIVALLDRESYESLLLDPDFSLTDTWIVSELHSIIRDYGTRRVF